MKHLFILSIVFLTTCCYSKDVNGSVNSLNKLNPDTLKGPSVANEDDSLHLSFHEFIYQFSINENYRRKHSSSPLTVINDNDTVLHNRYSWNEESLHFGIEFSTLLFSDTIIDQNREFYTNSGDHLVHVTFFSSEDSKIHRYQFQRRENTWFLRSIESESLSTSNEDSFYHFIINFGRDPSYAKSHVWDHATYSSLDDETMKIVSRPFKPEDISEHAYIFKKYTYR